ncbi:MAG: hypothetical protein K5919_09200 [Clostridiales bacterium]|nr:hypothetical protein [Clostridiales bacterium]
MKKSFLILALILAAVLLAGCGGSDETYPEAGASQQQKDPMTVETPTDAPARADTSLPEGYDPASEEDSGNYVSGAAYDSMGRQIYAGATPKALNPVDLPTPTPRPPLNFTYADAKADNLKLTFQAPVGWRMDVSASDTLVLQDPNMYDNVNATMTVKILSVPATYKLADTKTEVKNMLKEIGQYNYTEWKPTELAARTLLHKDGYYANYRGVQYDGTIVRGRVMVALLDGNRIITLHMSCPAGYNESYMNVVSHFRETLKQAQ